MRLGPLRLAARTSPSHGEDRGSIPLGVTNVKTVRKHGFCIGAGSSRTGGLKTRSIFNMNRAC